MPNQETIQVVCVAEFRALPGKVDALLGALYALIKPTLQEPGCLRYELNQRIEDPNWITFIEKWRDKPCFDRHCAMPYITDYFDNLRPRLVEQFEVKLYREIVP